MQKLRLNGNYGGVLGGSALAKGVGLNTSLRELHLHGNGIGDEGMRILGEELLRREKDNKKCRVSWRVFGGKVELENDEERQSTKALLRTENGNVGVLSR